MKLQAYKDAMRILSPQERKKVVVLLFILCVVGLGELAGLGSIFPFLSLLTDLNVIDTNPYIGFVYNFFGFTDKKIFAFCVGVGLISIFCLLQALSAFLKFYQHRFVNELGVSLSLQLFRKYLNRPYVFFLSENSHRLSQMVLSEVAQVLVGFLRPGAELIARVFIAGVISIFLVIFNPLASLVVFVLFGGYLLVVTGIFRKNLKEMGRQRILLNEKKYRIAGESFQGIKDIKIYKAEDFFENRLREVSDKYAYYTTRASLISELPGFLVNALMFSSLMAYALFLLYSNQNFVTQIPVLGVYAFAGYRLMPSLKLIYNELTKIRYSAPAFQKLVSELEEREESKELHNLKFDSRITLKNISYSYPGSEGVQLRDINLEIKKGDIVSFVGATGCGKSTLIDILCGLIQESDGSFEVDGSRLPTSERYSWANLFSYVPQFSFIFDDTLAKNIAMGLDDESIEEKKLIEATKQASIHDFIQQDKAVFQKRAGDRGAQLSGGQRQRLGLSRAFYFDRPFYILDEATSALDPLTEKTVLENIQKNKTEKTVIMISHRIESLTHCDKIFVMNEGRIESQGSFDELRESCPTFQRLLKKESIVHENCTV